jgi:hypothetical protein
MAWWQHPFSSLAGRKAGALLGRVARVLSAQYLRLKALGLFVHVWRACIFSTVWGSLLEVVAVGHRTQNAETQEGGSAAAIHQPSKCCVSYN